MNATVYAPTGWDAPDSSAADTQDYVRVYSDVLVAVKPRCVFEWGPGINTRMALDAGAHVFSVEQDVRWLHPHHPWLVQYHLDVGNVLYPTLLGQLYCQVHFVDSRRRAECIRHVRHYCLVDNHVTVLHDAQRKRYWSALGSYRFVLVPELRTAVATNDAARRDALMQMWPQLTKSK